MPTRHRDDAPGVHHVWVNATGNELYYLDEVDRMAWLRGLISATTRYEWTCIAFCQMTTHVHLLLEVRDWTLPRGMQRLNFDYSRRFNARHSRPGQFVRRRYGNRRIGSAEDLLGAFVYVVLNPVKAGICPRAEDWRWSSLATTLGIVDDFPFVDTSLVLAEFGGSKERLRAFVAAQQDAHLTKEATSDRLTTGRVRYGRVRP
jgi:REP element-mobilizing transposase RayT